MPAAIWDLGRKEKRKENEEEGKRGRKDRRNERKRRKNYLWRIRQRGNNLKTGAERAKKCSYLDITVLTDIGTLFNLYNINSKKCIIPSPRKK